MKAIISTVLVAAIFVGCDVAIEGEDCHKDLTIVNESMDTVIISKLATYYEKPLCFLSKEAVLAPGASYTDHYSKTCFEGIVAAGTNYYAVDPDHFNEEHFYDCDSLLIKNTVLKHYALNASHLGELKKTDFTISYP